MPGSFKSFASSKGFKNATLIAASKPRPARRLNQRIRTPGQHTQRFKSVGDAVDHVIQGLAGGPPLPYLEFEMIPGNNGKQ